MEDPWIADVSDGPYNLRLTDTVKGKGQNEITYYCFKNKPRGTARAISPHESGVTDGVYSVILRVSRSEKKQECTLSLMVSPGIDYAGAQAAIALANKSAGKTSADVPSPTDSITVPLRLGEVVHSSASKNNTAFESYAYDYWGDSLNAPWLDESLNAIRDSGLFVQCDLMIKDYISTSAQVRKVYRFTYTGEKKLPDFNVSIREVDDSATLPYDLQVAVTHDYRSSHVLVRVKYNPGLTYAGEGQKEGDTFNGTVKPVEGQQGGGSGDKWVWRTVTKRCDACRGSGRCPVCNGTGWYRRFGESVKCDPKCPSCNGAGSWEIQEYVRK